MTNFEIASKLPYFTLDIWRFISYTIVNFKNQRRNEMKITKTVKSIKIGKADISITLTRGLHTREIDPDFPCGEYTYGSSDRITIEVIIDGKRVDSKNLSIHPELTRTPTPRDPNYQQAIRGGYQLLGERTYLKPEQVEMIKQAIAELRATPKSQEQIDYEAARARAERIEEKAEAEYQANYKRVMDAMNQ